MYSNAINDYLYHNQFPFPPQNIPQIKCFVVTNINEAKTALIDPLSTNLFVDTTNGKIYLKKISNNGQAQFLVYSVEQEKVETDPMIEISQRLDKIEKYLGGQYDKSISSDAGYEQSAIVPKQSVADSIRANETTEPTGFSEDARNDKWKIR